MTVTHSSTPRRAAPVRPMAVRRKVEAWLAEADGAAAIALRARPEWTSDPVLAIGGATVRVVPCTTPLAVRAALYGRAGDERLVLLTDLSDEELGDGLLARLSKHQVRTVGAWDLVRQLFGGADPAPGLSHVGRWVAEALTDHAPPDGWPRPPGVVTRDHALRCLAARLLGIDHEQIDSAGILQWTTNAAAVLRFTGLPADTVEGLTGFLVDVAGAAVAPVMAAVRAGHGADALPLGLLAGVLWPGQGAGPEDGPVATEIAVARARLEPWFGGARWTDAQALAYRAAAEAWLDRADASGHPDDTAAARRVRQRAEQIAGQLDMTGLLAASAVLPSGLTRRLHAFAAAVRRATPATPATGGGTPPVAGGGTPPVAGGGTPPVAGGGTPPATGGGTADLAAVGRAQAALAAVEEHRAAEHHRVDTARMAVRLLRWLATADGPAPATLYEAVHRHVRDDGWVDRARLDVFHGSTDPVLGEAYRLLHRAVDARRARHDERFAALLAAATAAEAEPGSLLRVEDVLDRVVRPILDRGRRVLLLVLDGMGMAAATELADSLAATRVWVELTPDGGPRTGVLAALPTVTEVSRCSLLSGRIAVGGQAEERAALQKLFPGTVLLHKASLRGGAGATFDPDVANALADPAKPLVAAVVNTIDDALDRGHPDTVEWGTRTVPAVRDLLGLAPDRVVVLVSDHGHVVDRGPDALTRPGPRGENRWRPATTPPGDGEVAVTGSRVGTAGGSVVLPWREALRYGPRKAGYHGGASPAEAVIPLLVFTAGDEHAVPGWAGAPVASPAWWREAAPEATPPPEAVPAAVPAGPPAAPRRRTRPRPAQEGTLFDVPAAAIRPRREASPHPPPPPAPVPTAEPAPAPRPGPPGPPDLVATLLASDVYAQRRGTRAPLPDERVAALLGVLLAGGGRATMDTLAARAGVPAHRIAGTVTALRKLLQVEGYPVVEVDADGRTVKLDRDLLVEQFGLQQAEFQRAERERAERERP